MAAYAGGVPPVPLVPGPAGSNGAPVATSANGPANGNAASRSETDAEYRRF